MLQNQDLTWKIGFAGAENEPSGFSSLDVLIHQSLELHYNISRSFSDGLTLSAQKSRRPYLATVVCTGTGVTTLDVWGCKHQNRPCRFGIIIRMSSAIHAIMR